MGETKYKGLDSVTARQLLGSGAERRTVLKCTPWINREGWTINLTPREVERFRLLLSKARRLGGKADNLTMRVEIQDAPHA